MHEMNAYRRQHDLFVCPKLFGGVSQREAVHPHCGEDNGTIGLERLRHVSRLYNNTLWSALHSGVQWCGVVLCHAVTVAVWWWEG